MKKLTFSAKPTKISMTGHTALIIQSNTTFLENKTVKLT